MLQTLHPLRNISDQTKIGWDAIEIIAGYLVETLDFGLEGRNVPDVTDMVESMCDSSHHGDPEVSSHPAVQAS